MGGCCTFHGSFCVTSRPVVVLSFKVGNLDRLLLQAHRELFAPAHRVGAFCPLPGPQTTLEQGWPAACCCSLRLHGCEAQAQDGKAQKELLVCVEGQEHVISAGSFQKLVTRGNVIW